MRRLLCLGCLLAPLIVQAEGDKELPKAYRWVDKNGGVHFSSTPPSSDAKATEFDLRQPNTIIHQENREVMQQQGQEMSDRSEAARQLRQQLLQQLNDLQKNLADAKEAYAKGETPQPGETQRLVGGGARLSEAYHRRREAEAKQVEQLEQQIESLYGELNKLR